MFTNLYSVDWNRSELPEMLVCLYRRIARSPHPLLQNLEILEDFRKAIPTQTKSGGTLNRTLFGPVMFYDFQANRTFSGNFHLSDITKSQILSTCACSAHDIQWIHFEVFFISEKPFELLKAQYDHSE